MSELSRIYRQEPKTPYDPKRSLLRGVFPALFWLAVWEAISLIVGAELLVPSPRRVVLRWLELAGTPKFWLSTALSLGRVALGFAAGTFIGVLLAFLTRYFGLARLLLTPVIRVVRAVPVASFIILALVWLKSRQLPFFIAALMAFPVVYRNVLEGIRGTSRALLEMAQVFRVPLSRRLRGIYLPQVLPYFRAAADTALGLSWKAGTAAEVIGLCSGTIGERLYTAKVYFQTADLFAWTAVIVLLSALFEKLFLRGVDALTERWYA